MNWGKPFILFFPFWYPQLNTIYPILTTLSILKSLKYSHLSSCLHPQPIHLTLYWKISRLLWQTRFISYQRFATSILYHYIGWMYTFFIVYAPYIATRLFNTPNALSKNQNQTVCVDCTVFPHLPPFETLYPYRWNWLYWLHWGNHLLTPFITSDSNIHVSSGVCSQLWYFISPAIS